jgi:hypothetical protein
MDPSQVRTRIMQDHDTLREHLSELEEACLTMLSDRQHAICVRQLAGKLLQALTQHTELEDAILAPALAEIDAWGAVRADQLLTHHQSQRGRIHELTSLYATQLDAEDVSRITHSFIAELRADMEHEERDLLHPDLLRDDLTVVGSNSG